MEQKTYDESFVPKDNLNIILLMLKGFNAGSKILQKLWITDKTQDKVLKKKKKKPNRLSTLKRMKNMTLIIPSFLGPLNVFFNFYINTYY